ncbi:hypothetical protein BaRGS_00025909 [Batillaria attramentaria]|uniref:Uncharacterized protein n=1 Tax=Batillaria attramentaria TaxID=370345 RepID=A0ABD0K7A6_9CAEN
MRVRHHRAAASWVLKAKPLVEAKSAVGRLPPSTPSTDASKCKTEALALSRTFTLHTPKTHDIGNHTETILQSKPLYRRAGSNAAIQSKVWLLLLAKAFVGVPCPGTDKTLQSHKVTTCVPLCQSLAINSIGTYAHKAELLVLQGYTELLEISQKISMVTSRTRHGSILGKEHLCTDTSSQPLGSCIHSYTAIMNEEVNTANNVAATVGYIIVSDALEGEGRLDTVPVRRRALSGVVGTSG